MSHGQCYTLSDTFKCYYSYIYLYISILTYSVLVTVNLTVKQSVKHMMPIDNVIRIHILMYSLIVIGQDAYVRNGTAFQLHHFK